jgi:hypothetical protein
MSIVEKEKPMKTKVKMTMLLMTGLLAMSAHGAEGFPVFSLDGGHGANQAVTRLAWLSEAERATLRKQWQDLPPDERDRVRRKLRQDRGDAVEDGYGMGFEYRRQEPRDGEYRDPARHWDKSRDRDKRRDERDDRR